MHFQYMQIKWCNLTEGHLPVCHKTLNISTLFILSVSLLKSYSKESLLEPQEYGPTFILLPLCLLLNCKIPIANVCHFCHWGGGGDRETLTVKNERLEPAPYPQKSLLALTGWFFFFFWSNGYKKGETVFSWKNHQFLSVNRCSEH